MVDAELPNLRGPAILGEAALLQQTDYAYTLWQLGYR